MPLAMHSDSGYAFPGPSPGSSGAPFYRHMDWPEGVAQGGNTIRYELWFPVAVTLSSIRGYMGSVNNQGTYLLTVTNLGTTNTMLSAATFNMNTLGSGVVTNVPVTAVGADLALLDMGIMRLDLTSNNGAFNGTGIYLAVYATVT